MLRFAKRPDITRQLLLLLAAFDPADRFFFSHQQYVRLASPVGVYNNYDRGHRLAQGAFLDHFEIDCWVVVTDGHPQQHTTHNCEHFNQYKAYGHAYVALWRVAAQPDLVRVLERKIAKHNLQAVEPLRFPDTPEFDDVPDCIYNLRLGLLEEAKTHIGLPGAENPSGTAPPGTLWKAHGEGAVVDHQLVDLDGHDPERGYEEYSDNVHVDFVLPVRAEDRNEAKRKFVVVGQRLGMFIYWTDNTDTQHEETFVMVPRLGVDIAMVYRAVSLFYPFYE